ncbi:ADP-ribosylation factor-like protein 16 isoform X2 [Rhinichthys klamathensis goyatoka]|uniref:ADP-ribosylation factor-like protein 16 isoform X2 n=2 Tax=Rhinichthys klamathensis goyatoka TaxID=3034132 RepID=UPI0024B5B7BE|nr:ADP-ribosylation factor-like protein 16 isoform X2 [Rhinichthys klamathensis goyatoka]
MCLLLGATGVGKTLLLKRLQKLCQMDAHADLGEAPVTLPTVGTNLTDLIFRRKKITIRELGGCMGPIWPKYYLDCTSVIFVVDCGNIGQISSSCVQLLSVLSAEPLHAAAVLILFNKRDLPCTMSLVELKSLFRMDDIIRTAPQSITTLEISGRSGQGLQDVLAWLFPNRSDT